jgi:hypothetical protein
MPLKSDLTIDWSKLQDSAISEQTRTCNDALMKVAKAEPPKWWEVRSMLLGSYSLTIRGANIGYVKC